MKIFANKDIKNFFLAISVIWTVFLLLAEGFEWLLYQKFSLYLLLLSLLAAGAMWVVCFNYFSRQNKVMEQAVAQINAYLAGDVNARIECDNEGELSPIGIICGVLVGIVTVLLAAQSPAKRAARVSPMAAVAGNEASALTVHHTSKLSFPPCGRCREFIAQIDNQNIETQIVLPEMEEVLLKDLLPERWDGKWN